MKKLVLAGLFAIALIALSQQQASAWVNQRFSVGLSWSRQSGGNNFGWGAYRNGQPPGPESFGGGHYDPGFAPSFVLLTTCPSTAIFQTSPAGVTAAQT